jgi:colanic acid/amylovoran biosynthesis glycosyltransferase
MKVAFLTPPFPRYSETFIINQVSALLDQGHDVTVFSHGKVENPAEHDILDRHNMEENVVYVNKIKNYTQGIEEYLDSLFRPQSHSDILDAIRRGKQGPDRLAVKKIADKLEHFDVFHAHFGPIARRWDFLSELYEQVPFVATYYGYDVTARLHPDSYDFYSKVGHWNSIDLAIGISEHIRSRMIVAGCPENITTVLPLGIDADLFEFSPTTYNIGDKLQMVSTCRHTEKKGIEYAIRAAGRLKNRGINVSYTIAGDGELTQLYHDVAVEAGVEKDIEFAGRVPQERVSELMQDAHLYIQPSVTAQNGDMEGQGLVFQEAQATGTPPVATFHDGIPEGVRHGDTGRLAPERDVSRLADELEYFVEHPRKVDQYAKRGRELIESEYDYAKLGRKQEELYESLIKAKK